MDEYRQTLAMLKTFKAPLTLVIAGNHDFSLDHTAFKAKIEEANRINGFPIEADLVEREFGGYGLARKLFADAKKDGIILLDEGTHDFALANGGKLRVYSSPYTPSSSSSEGWGFPYNESEGHKFEFQMDTDIVMTHGPPRGVMDMSADKKRIGCPDLFAAVNVTWRPEISDKPSHFSDVDHEKSQLVGNLTSLGGTREQRLELYKEHRYCSAGSLRNNMSSSELKSTMFVNAALKEGGELQHYPWIIDIDIPRSESGVAPKTERKRRREESPQELKEARKLSNRS
ncbi:hypothetical protein BDP55DRAFT_751614 [Colletotrichum godetiae]|uniref:Calcineurin-like phosphoesterase domain-containing protein n=1 Tax=Colletotrichum godetiae TaxID=1209918 RepID=A0AAJ0AGT0_9PEZI|nr:uncharacterized protein BDP55DRAFT_751614 [Colletotrichum godetiae]KAK1672163.1 hypothetical protein BDP55DRAFT_751614 [Colletotrichum godetiae]